MVHRVRVIRTSVSGWVHDNQLPFVLHTPVRSPACYRSSLVLYPEVILSPARSSALPFRFLGMDVPGFPGVALTPRHDVRIALTFHIEGSVNIPS